MGANLPDCIFRLEVDFGSMCPGRGSAERWGICCGVGFVREEARCVEERLYMVVQGSPGDVSEF